MNANVIKTKLIDYLIAKNEDAIIGNEVAFGFNKNMADIVQLSRNKSYAFEIKGDKDDFRRLLPKQIELYREVFDYLYIVMTVKHISHSHKIDQNIGIMLITPDYDITVIRKAKRQPKSNKMEIVETINSQFLKNYFGIVGNKTSAEIRQIVVKKSIGIVKKVLFDYLKFILEPKFKIFLNEKGEQSHIEDVPLLSLYHRIIT